MASFKQKATTLIEALPYIQKYHHKIVVIKYGGNAMVNHQLRENVMKDIVLLKNVGLDPVIIHGGGPAINRAMKKANIKPKFERGLRVTDKKTINNIKANPNVSLVVWHKNWEENCKFYRE